MRGRSKLVRGLSLASIAAVALFVVPVASAATTIGETFTPTAICGADTTRLQSTSPGGQYEVKTAGAINSWSYQSPALAADVPPQLRLKVARRAGGDNFTIIGESPIMSPVAGNLNTYPVQIAVQAGDLIGTYVGPGAGNNRCSRSNTAYQRHAKFGDVPPGTTATFTLAPNPNFQLDVSANLETTTCKGKAPTMAGTPGPDTLIGTPNADVIVGIEGKDTINGLAGNDIECGGPGKDTLKGGANRDTLLGQGGKDKLKGGGARDVCKGGKKPDTASGCEVERSI